MVRALRIPTEPDDPITELEVFQLEDYQAAVGGWIEPVDIPELGVTMYVHEEGLVLGLPFNSRAAFLWWYFVPEARQKAMLVGPALVVGQPDRNGDSTDIPARVAEMLKPDMAGGKSLEEAGAEFVLASGNDSVIFSDPVSDPFDNTDADADRNVDVQAQALGGVLHSQSLEFM